MLFFPNLRTPDLIHGELWYYSFGEEVIQLRKHKHLNKQTAKLRGLENFTCPRNLWISGTCLTASLKKYRRRK